MSRRGDPSAILQAGAALNGRSGRRFWRALDELAETPAFQAAVRAEFPAAFAGLSGIGRRGLLKAMGASLALAGLAACAPKGDPRALPYVVAPTDFDPDKPRFYATAVMMAGYAQPVLGETWAARPTKLEGSPDHPASLGATDAFTQAALLGLYDPDRSQTPLNLGRPAAWTALDAMLVANAARMDAVQGEGLRILTGASSSPTLARQMDGLLKRWPKARWHVFEPVEEAEREAAVQAAFGRPLELHPRLDRAEVVVSLDDDLLGPGPRQTLNARRWSTRRKAFQAGQGGALLLVAEPTPSLTGAVASDRLVASHGRIAVMAQALAAAIGVAGATAPAGLSVREAEWIKAAVDVLKARPGLGLVSVGPWQPAAVQALGLAINQRLGAFGKTLTFSEPIRLRPPGDGSLAALVSDMVAGQVDTLVVLDANPAYAAPEDLGFAAAARRVRLVVHAGLHGDETAAVAHWHAPLQHDLESWSDGRGADGSAVIQQPLVRPFYDVRGRQAFLEAVQGRLGADEHALVQATWRERMTGDFDKAWSDAVWRGVVPDTAPAEVMPTFGSAPSTAPPPPMPPAGGLIVLFRPDPTLWDGRFANNAWLQELPKPLNKVTWSNVVAVSPGLAKAQGLANGDVVRLSAGGRSLEGPVWITPGQERSSVTVFLGYGRNLPDQTGDGHGYDAYALRAAGSPWVLAGASLAPTGRSVKLATTQLSGALDGQDFVRTVPASQASALRQGTASAERQPSFYPRQKPSPGPSWGMSIDTDLCIGCNACVTACDAENNIAMVGAEQVAMGREMHWLRVDHYYAGSPDAPEMFFQPVPCMHCEDAPCEMGCPVNATVHSPDGLNLQVYNRCIGTRTCSSYCPYKVRHFNWFDFTQHDPAQLRAARNPDVTVRERGVMEKCTYCIQRIREAGINAELEGRVVREGEVRTACQQACPTDAIMFGNVRDPTSAVSRRKALARDYTLIEEANTRPRTTYLARIDDRPAGDKNGPGGEGDGHG